MKINELFSTPPFLWPKVIKYYLFRIFRMPISNVDSNWIYFLKIASTYHIKVLRDSKDFIIYSPKFNHRVRVRSGESSDILVYIQIFFHGEYEPLIKFLTEKEKLVIVDAGANVGFFALFANYYSPYSTIYCIEPSHTNCQQIAAQLQLNDLENLNIEQAALWYENTLLELTSKSDNLEWNYSVIENMKGTIEAVTLSSLLAKYNINGIDIFKMDIEGTEAKLFNDEQFLNLIREKVKVMVIETHDVIEKNSIAHWLKSNDFNVDVKGELLFANKM